MCILFPGSDFVSRIFDLIVLVYDLSLSFCFYKTPSVPLRSLLVFFVSNV